MVYDRLVHLSLSLWSCVIVMPWWRDSVQKGPVSNLWSLLFSWIQESALNVVVVHHSARISTNLGSVKRVGAFNIKSCGNWYLSVCLCCSYAYIATLRRHRGWLLLLLSQTHFRLRLSSHPKDLLWRTTHRLRETCFGSTSITTLFLPN